MTEVGIRELKTQASDIIRRVRENNESYVVTYRGRPVARLEPVQDAEARLARDLAVLEDMDRVAEEVARYWPEGLSAADAVSEDRREL